VRAKIENPAGSTADDKDYGKYKVYKDKVEIRATLDRPAGSTDPIAVSVRLQSCNDKVCLPTATVPLKLP
jgi:DsbC/DsbD-like thiol-disulfide interchange protein